MQQVAQVVTGRVPVHLQSQKDCPAAAVVIVEALFEIGSVVARPEGNQSHLPYSTAAKVRHQLVAIKQRRPSSYSTQMDSFLISLTRPLDLLY